MLGVEVKILMLVFASVFMVSCAGFTNIEAELLDSQKKARNWYKKEVGKKAKFLMNCDKVNVKPDSRFYLYQPGLLNTYYFAKTNPTTDSEFARFPYSFLVSGCNKRVILMLVSSNRKSLCDAFTYFDYRCEIIQDSSFTESK